MTFSDILALITQSQTIILGTFDTSEDGTPSPIQYCTSRWQFLTENSTFISLFNIAKGGRGRSRQGVPILLAETEALEELTWFRSLRAWPTGYRNDDN